MNYLTTNFDAADAADRAREFICAARNRNDAMRDIEPVSRPAVSPVLSAAAIAEEARLCAQHAATAYVAARAKLGTETRAAARLARRGYDASDCRRMRSTAMRQLNKARTFLRAAERRHADAMVALDCARIADLPTLAA